jgi:hypothetical protein
MADVPSPQTPGKKVTHRGVSLKLVGQKAFFS